MPGDPRAVSRVLRREAVFSLQQAGIDNQIIGTVMEIHSRTVKRTLLRDPAKLHDAPRSGRSPKYNMSEQTQIISFYCHTPPLPGLRRWTLSLATTYLNAHPEIIGETVTRASLHRTLKHHGRRSHVRSDNCHIIDPQHFPKQEHILDVYQRHGDNLFLFDECPCLQAITRDTPDLVDDNGARKVDGRYHRNGTTDLIAVMKYSTGKIFSRCTSNHKTPTLIRVLREHIAEQGKDAQIHYICDNLNPHFSEQLCSAIAKLCGLNSPEPRELRTGEKRREWLQREDKRIVFHFLPYHASWLNLVEIWFGLLHQHCLKDRQCTTVALLRALIKDYVTTWNDNFAHPFTMKYTGEGLHERVVRCFTRTIKRFEVDPIHTPYLGNQMLLMGNLFTDYHDKVPSGNWEEFIHVFTDSRETITQLIESDKGPIRRKRALTALQQLTNIVTEPTKGAEKSTA